MQKFSTWFLIGLSTFVVACGGSGDEGGADREELDAGISDSGHADSGEPEADVPDGGNADGGEADADVPDSGDADSGEKDADVCPEDLLLCDGACIDPLSDLLHCGTCDFACPSDVKNAQPVCAGGICALDCTVGYSDCDDDKESCETAIAESDPNNCGGCGIRCEATEACEVDHCVDLLPTVVMASPVADAIDVRMHASIILAFSEAVVLGTDWFTLSCRESGERGIADMTVSGDALELILTPKTPFWPNESCTLRIHAAQVRDADDDDPPDTMESDYVVSFTTAKVVPLLHEDFEAGMPADWKLFDVDGRVPAGGTAYVDKAWVVREDFKFDKTNQVAFSTSFYLPEGSSDDWMMTPALELPRGDNKCALSWKAVTYDPVYRDGYEVRISTTNATPAGGLANPPLVSIASENSEWTKRSVSLAPYAGTSVFLAFRNVSKDMFVLLVDDVDVSCDP